MEQKVIKPQALESLLASLKTSHHRLMVATNGSWYSPEDREEERLALAKSLKDANHAVQELTETTDPELRRLRDALLIEATLSESAVKDPNILKR